MLQMFGIRLNDMWKKTQTKLNSLTLSVYEYIRPLSLIKIEIFIIYKLRVGGWSGGIYQLRSAIAKIMCKKNKGSIK